MGAFYGVSGLREYRSSIFTPLYESSTDAESLIWSEVAENVNLCSSVRSVLEFLEVRAKMKITQAGSAANKLGANGRRLVEGQSARMTL